MAVEKNVNSADDKNTWLSYSRIFGQYVIYSRLNDGASDSYGCYLSQYKLRVK